MSVKLYDEFQCSNKRMEQLKEIKIEMELAKALEDMDRLKELATELRKLTVSSKLSRLFKFSATNSLNH